MPLRALPSRKPRGDNPLRHTGDTVYQPVLAEAGSRPQAIEPEASRCPMHAMRLQSDALQPDDELVLPKPKRMAASYSTNEQGATELHLYYGEKEILFDEPELFAFGEGLAKQTSFPAVSATSWGAGYEWPRVRELLEHLIDEGILEFARDHAAKAASAYGPRPSPCPVMQSTVARTWFECEAITQELTGRSLELGYLELI